MAQDFANRHSKGAPTSRTTQKSNGGRSPAAAPRAAKAPPGRNYASQSGSRGLWFGAGLLAGLFCALLLYLWLVAPRAGELARLLDPPVTGGTVITPSDDIEKMQWDFYEIFPRSEVPVVEEYGPAGTKTRVAESQVYVLQTGSFRAAADADKLRAELILLGMNVFIKVIEKDGQTWHRVLVGPMEAGLEMDRNRRALAEANIEALSLRVNR